MERRADTSNDTRSWRELVLRRAGMARHVARAVAADERYDVHQLSSLLEQGCPEQVALRIVAPVDELPLGARRAGSA
jgi:hypothetical protein